MAAIPINHIKNFARAVRLILSITNSHKINKPITMPDKALISESRRLTRKLFLGDGLGSLKNSLKPSFTYCQNVIATQKYLFTRYLLSARSGLTVCVSGVCRIEDNSRQRRNHHLGRSGTRPLHAVLGGVLLWLEPMPPNHHFDCDPVLRHVRFPSGSQIRNSDNLRFRLCLHHHS